MSTSTLKQRLRKLEALKGPFPLADFSVVTDTPQALFLDWLETAIAAGLTEPHAMTLSTVDEYGLPDARVLILKNVDSRGWHFAASAVSPKGRQIEKQPAVALSFHWKELGRQVRIRGQARVLSEKECGEDFLGRAVDARANVLLERQSKPLDAPDSVAAAIAGARQRIDAQPDLVAPAWRVYAVAACSVEFWQGATDRLHKRLQFQWNADDGIWEKQWLWP